MQDELEVKDDLQEITIDVMNEDRWIASLSCDFETTFAELHYEICERIHLHPESFYRFYLPKLRISMRDIPRSKDLSSDEQLLMFLTVGDDCYYQNQNQRVRLKIRSIGEAIEKINIERDMRRAYASLAETVIKNTYMKRNRVQRDNLTLLYGLASDLLQNQVQRVLPDQSTLVFNLKGNHLIAFCVVTQARDQIEYFFFPDQKSFSCYVLARQDPYLPNMHREKYKDGMTMVFSRKPLKESETTKPYNSQMYVEHSCYVYFYDVKRGYDIDVVNNAQAKELMRYLVALQKALVKIKAFRMDFFDTNSSLYIGYNPHTKKTLLQKGPKAVLALNDLPYENQENIAKLQCYRHTIENVELDYFLFVRQPIKNKDERGRYLVEGVCVGNKARRVRSDTFENNEQIAHMMQDLLLDMIEIIGLPQRVLVRDRCVYSYIHDFCARLSIEVAIYARLPKVDAFHHSRLKK